MREFQKNARGEVVRITREEYKGADLVNIRVWFTASDGELRPSKNGLTIRGDQIPQMIEALLGVQDEGVPEGVRS